MQILRKVVLHMDRPPETPVIHLRQGDSGSGDPAKVLLTQNAPDTLRYPVRLSVSKNRSLRTRPQPGVAIP